MPNVTFSLANAAVAEPATIAATATEILNLLLMNTTLILAARIMLRTFDTKESTSKTHAMARRAGSMPARIALSRTGRAVMLFPLASCLFFGRKSILNAAAAQSP